MYPTQSTIYSDLTLLIAAAVSVDSLILKSTEKPGVSTPLIRSAEELNTAIDTMIRKRLEERAKLFMAGDISSLKFLEGVAPFVNCYNKGLRLGPKENR